MTRFTPAASFGENYVMDIMSSALMSDQFIDDKGNALGNHAMKVRLRLCDEVE